MNWKKTQLSDPLTQPNKTLKSFIIHHPTLRRILKCNSKYCSCWKLEFNIHAFWLKKKIRRKRKPYGELKWTMMKKKKKMRKWKIILSGKRIDRWNQLLWFAWLSNQGKLLNFHWFGFVYNKLLPNHTKPKPKLFAFLLFNGTI